MATTAAVLLLNDQANVAAIGQGSSEGHSTILGLIAGQGALTIGHNPVAIGALDYIDIVDWHSSDSLRETHSRDNAAHTSSIWGTTGHLIRPEAILFCSRDGDSAQCTIRVDVSTAFRRGLGIVVGRRQMEGALAEIYIWSLSSLIFGAASSR